MNRNLSSCAMRATPEWDFPQLHTEVRTGIPQICYSISASLVIVLWLLQLFSWLRLQIRGEEENSNCWPTSPTLQQEGKIKELTKLKGTRVVYSATTPLAESPPATKFPPPVLRERPKPTQPSPPNELVILCPIVTHVCTHSAYTERNTTFVAQTAISLQMFGACISSVIGILESCKLAGITTGFNYQVVRSWAKEIYVDFFSILTSLENVMDDRLDKELESGKGKHPKWVSLISDENFKLTLGSLCWTMPM